MYSAKVEKQDFAERLKGLRNFHFFFFHFEFFIASITTC